MNSNSVFQMVFEVLTLQWALDIAKGSCEESPDQGEVQSLCGFRAEILCLFKSKHPVCSQLWSPLNFWCGKTFGHRCNVFMNIRFWLVAEIWQTCWYFLLALIYLENISEKQKVKKENFTKVQSSDLLWAEIMPGQPHKSPLFIRMCFALQLTYWLHCFYLLPQLKRNLSAWFP